MRQIGDFLKTQELTRDRCYRYGGDEFVILCRTIDTVGLKAVITALKQRFESKWFLREGEVICRCSVGISRYPMDSGCAADLIHKADVAMYYAKRSGTGLVYFHHDGDMISDETFFRL